MSLNKKNTQNDPQLVAGKFSNSEISSTAILFEEDDDSDYSKTHDEQVLDKSEYFQQEQNNYQKYGKSLQIIPEKIKVEPKVEQKLMKEQETPIPYVKNRKYKQKRRKHLIYDPQQNTDSSNIKINDNNNDDHNPHNKQSQQSENIHQQNNKKIETIETAAESNIANKDQKDDIIYDDVQNGSCSLRKFANKKSKNLEIDKNQQFYYYESQRTQQNQDIQDDDQQQGSQQQQQSQQQDDDMIQNTQNNRQDKLNRNESTPSPTTQSALKNKTISKTFTANSLIDLLFTRIPENCSIECLIICKKSFFSSIRSYDLYLKADKKYLVTAIKNRIKISSEFEFKCNPYKNQNSKTLALLKSNFSGMQYTLTMGQNPNLQLACIDYSPNILGLSMRSINITQNTENKRIKIPQNKPFSLIKHYLQYEIDPRKKSAYRHFSTKKPKKNKQGEYVLDFMGIAKVPSVNNSVLENQKGQPVLILGKITDQVFGMKIIANKSNSLSIGESFGLAVSNLDCKLFVR